MLCACLFIIKIGTHRSVRAAAHPDHPDLKLLGFRVVYPPTPLSRGASDFVHDDQLTQE